MWRAVLIPAVLALAAPPAVLADSGSIRNIRLLPDSRLEATFSVAFPGCSPAGSQCVWTASATTTAPGRACTKPSDEHYVWTSGYADPNAETLTETASWLEESQAVRICLYGWKMGVDILLDDQVWERGAGAETASGGLSSVRSTSAGTVAYLQATASLCGDDGRAGCRWRVRLYERRDDGRCPAEGDGHLVYTSAPQTAAATIDRKAVFASLYGGRQARLCLYAERLEAGNDRVQLIAQTTFAAASGGGQSPAPPVFALDRARRAVATALTQQFGRAFTAARDYRRSCRRRSASRVRCAVAWTSFGDRYRGSVTVWLVGTQVHYGMTIKRTLG